ncbi:hypothetical protein [Cardinium endosymbiont of Dermatophagoides farinae]
MNLPVVKELLNLGARVNKKIKTGIPLYI